MADDENSTYSEETDEILNGIDQFYLASKLLNVCFITLITIVGIYGNLISTRIFVKKYRNKKNQQKLTIYLIVLSVSDLCVLVFHYLDHGFRSWINFMEAYSSNFNFVDKCLLCCKLVPYMRNVFRTMSVYILVSLTFQRFIIFYYPLGKAKLLSNWFIVKLFTFIVLFSLLINVSPLFINSLVQHNTNDDKNIYFCDVSQQLLDAQFITDIVFVFVTIILPTVFIFIFSVILFQHIKKNLPSSENRFFEISCLKKRPRTTVNAKNSKTSSSNSSDFVNERANRGNSHGDVRLNVKDHQGKFRTRNNYSIRTTYILVLISKWFIIFHLPYFVAWMLFRIYNQNVATMSTQQTTFDMISANLTESVNITALVNMTVLVDMIEANSHDHTDQSIQQQQTKILMKAFQNLFEILYLPNYSIHFFLYIFNIPSFRKSHRKIVNNFFKKSLDFFLYCILCCFDR